MYREEFFKIFYIAKKLACTYYSRIRSSATKVKITTQKQ